MNSGHSEKISISRGEDKFLVTNELIDYKNYSTPLSHVSPLKGWTVLLLLASRWQSAPQTEIPCAYCAKSIVIGSEKTQDAAVKKVAIWNAFRLQEVK